MNPPGTAFTSAFSNAAQNFYQSSSTLAANQALARVQQKAGTSANSKTTSHTSTGAAKPDQRLAAAQAAGKTALASLGLDGSALAASLQPSKKSASGKYTAPTNSQTGYSYVASSAASLSSLAAVNILA